MPLIAWSSGLSALVYSAFALRLLLLGYAWPIRRMARSTVWAAVVTTALWGWCSTAQALVGSHQLWFVCAGFDALRYAFWYAFLLTLLQPDGSNWAPPRMGWIVPVTIALLALHAVALIAAAWHVTVFGNPLSALLLSQLALAIYALVLLEQVLRSVDDDALWSIKPLCLGLAGIFTFDLYLYAQAVLFNRPDVDAFSIRALVHAMVVPLLAASAKRQNSWLSRVRLSPKAAFHTTALLAVGFYLMFLSGIGYYVRYFGGDWGRALQQGMLFLGLVALAVLAFSGSARARLRVLVGKHLFHYRFDYREEWLKFTHTLSARETARGVGQQVIKGLADMLESPAGGLWTRAENSDCFSQTARWNMSSVQATESANSPFCRFVEHSGWVINLDEYRAHRNRYGNLTLPQWLSDIPRAWLVIPLMVDESLIGFCILTGARTSIDVNWEVNDLLKIAGKQSAGFIAQMQATEALLEARKFESFNRMSAFVVHDLKNIITQLSLLIKNAKRHGENPEFQRDMLMTVESSLERMRHLLLQLRQGTTQPAPPTGVDLVSLIQRRAALCAAQNQRLDVQWSEPTHAWGHEEKLDRVLGHLVQNAFDATEATGRVWIRLERNGAEAKISIGDTGRGMTSSFIRDRLFRPFQTTKPNGMGIGAYESLQYMRDLGGSIDVQSAVNQGTVVTLTLPATEHTVEAGPMALKYA